MPARGDAAQRRPGRLLELGHREVLVRVNQVEQVVRHGGPGVGSGLGGPDVHAPVDAHGVDGDDLTVTAPEGELERRLGLARRRDADEGDRRQAPATGMRTRYRGGAVTASRWPER